MRFHQFKVHLQQAQRILLSTHLLPDGDGLGAEAALFHYLKAAKKSCRIYNPDSLPQRYQFLTEKKTHFLNPEPNNGVPKRIWQAVDLWIIVDTNDPRRLGKVWNDIAPRAKKIFFIDHHPEIRGASKVVYPPHASLISDPSSSSIGELLYHLFQELQLSPVDAAVAQGLYVSVMTDTNSFRYAGTTPIAHRIAAETIEKGINPEEIYQMIYSTKEVSHLKLLGHLLQNVQVAAQDQIAWLELDIDLRKRYRATADDTLSFLNLLLLIRDTEVICLFREEEDGTVRVSLKSKGRWPVNQLAMELGGGGHDFAAGMALACSLKQAVKTVIDRLVKLTRSSHGSLPVRKSRTQKPRGRS